MNFLSHYYFERNIRNPEQTLGAVLPDLIRMADKYVHIFPTKENLTFDDDPKAQSILRGWIRHIETDKSFHNNAFFAEKTRDIKPYIYPAIQGTPIKPFFFSHISLELLLDRQLLKDNWVHEGDFYQQLDDADKNALIRFLQANKLAEQPIWKILNAIEDFIKQRYLASYKNMPELSRALINICSSIWPDMMSEERKEELTHALNDYEDTLAHNYKAIFEEITGRLAHHQR